MADLKTSPGGGSVRAFIDAVENPNRRRDCRAIMKMMKDVTGSRPVLWGPSIVGYGTYHYRYASGREGDWFLCGFSPRKQNISLYLMSGFDGAAALMKKLGKYKTGKSCLYINALEDVDTDVLRSLIERGVEKARAQDVS